MKKKTIRVAAAIIYDQSQKNVLISQRKKDQDFSGLWEFPGGKIEDGEKPSNAMIREIQEELDITIHQDDFNEALTFNFEYPDKNIEFFFYNVFTFSGTPKGHENQKIEWVPLANIHERQFPDANWVVIDYLKEK